MNCNNTKRIPLNKPLKELFEMFENCVIFYFQRHNKEIPNISKTIFDSDYYLEISNEQYFLKLNFEEKEDSNHSLVQVEMDYTCKDLKPLKGKIINERTFQGLIDKLYLFEDKWYFLNPQEFGSLLNKQEIELNERIIMNKILANIFLLEMENN